MASPPQYPGNREWAALGRLEAALSERNDALANLNDAIAGLIDAGSPGGQAYARRRYERAEQRVRSLTRHILEDLDWGLRDEVDYLVIRARRAARRARAVQLAKRIPADRVDRQVRAARLLARRARMTS